MAVSVDAVRVVALKPWKPAVINTVPTNKQPQTNPDKEIPSARLFPLSQFFDRLMSAYIDSIDPDLGEDESSRRAREFTSLATRFLAEQTETIYQIVATQALATDILSNIEAFTEQVNEWGRFQSTSVPEDAPGDSRGTQIVRSVIRHDELQSKIRKIERDLVICFRKTNVTNIDSMVRPSTYFMLAGRKLVSLDKGAWGNHNEVLPDYEVPSGCIVQNDVMTDSEGYYSELNDKLSKGEQISVFGLELLTRRYCGIKKGDTIFAVRLEGGTWRQVSNWRDLSLSIDALTDQGILELQVGATGEASQRIVSVRYE
jgi:hypothetical protein